MKPVCIISFPVPSPCRVLPTEERNPLLAAREHGNCLSHPVPVTFWFGLAQHLEDLGVGGVVAERPEHVPALPVADLHRPRWRPVEQPEGFSELCGEEQLRVAPLPLRGSTSCLAGREGTDTCTLCPLNMPQS